MFHAIITVVLAAALVAAWSGEVLAQEVTALYETKTHTVKEGPHKGATLPYRLMRPEGAKPQAAGAGKKYPVVLFLHGAGERGDDNAAQLKFLPTHLSEPEQREKFSAFVIAPQCPKEQRWGTLDWRNDIREYPDQMSAQMQAVIEILDNVLKDPAADADRVYLTGLSMGGFGSWELASRRPELFAAVVPICGGGDVAHAHKLVELPLWAWHGDADKAVPVEQTRRMIEAIKQAGGHPRYTELPGVGHNSWTPAYTGDELLPWMFKQKRSRK